MARMTDEEAEKLDEYYTENTIMPTGKPGFFARRARARMVILDDFTATYLEGKAEAERKTPADIIGDLVRNEISVAASL
jgi:hypothetical protein